MTKEIFDGSAVTPKIVESGPTWKITGADTIIMLKDWVERNDRGLVFKFKKRKREIKNEAFKK